MKPFSLSDVAYRVSVVLPDASMAVAGAAVGIVAISSYARGATLTAAMLALIILPATTFTIFFYRMVERTLRTQPTYFYLHPLTLSLAHADHMGATGDNLKRTLTTREFIKCIFGFFVLNGLREMFWAARLRLTGARLVAGSRAPNVRLHTIDGNSGTWLLNLCKKSRPLIVNFGSCT